MMNSVLSAVSVFVCVCARLCMKQRQKERNGCYFIGYCLKFRENDKVSGWKDSFDGDSATAFSISKKKKSYKTDFSTIGSSQENKYNKKKKENRRVGR